MKTLKLLPLALILFVSCKKNSIDNNIEEPEVNPPISATPIIKEFSGYLGMPGNAAFLTADKNILICGSDSTPDNFSGGKLTVIKSTKSGTILWQKNYKIGNTSWGTSITELNGNYFVCGKVWTTAVSMINRHRVFLAKMNANGDTLWTKYYTVNQGNQSDCKIIKTIDNNLVIAGDVDAGQNHIYAMKLSQDGDIIWSNNYPVANEETLRNIIETVNGDYLITGMYTDNTHGNYNTLFIRLNSSGTKLWDKKTDLERYVFAGIELPDGSIMTTGYKTGAIYGWVQAYLDKCDNLGNPVWQKDYGMDNTNEVGHTIKYNSNNTITIGGLSQSKFYILNTDLNGNIQWQKSFGPPNGVKENEMSMLGDPLNNNLLLGFNTITVQVKPLPAPAENISTIYYSKLDKDGNFF